MNPYELIGKYLAFDNENGMVWAYITDVRQLRDSNKYKLISNHMRIKGDETPVREIKGVERALDWDYLKDREKLIFDPSTQKITFPDTINEKKDTMILAMLDAKSIKPFGTKAMALGLEDWLKLVKDEELKELLSSEFIKRTIENYESYEQTDL